MPSEHLVCTPGTTSLVLRRAGRIFSCKLCSSWQKCAAATSTTDSTSYSPSRCGGSERLRQSAKTLSPRILGAVRRHPMFFWQLSLGNHLWRARARKTSSRSLRELRGSGQHPLAAPLQRPPPPRGIWSSRNQLPAERKPTHPLAIHSR